MPLTFPNRAPTQSLSWRILTVQHENVEPMYRLFNIFIGIGQTNSLPRSGRDCWAFAGVIDARTTDRLPPYRAAGGLVATGALLVRGGSVVIREDFARAFWDEIVC